MAIAVLWVPGDIAAVRLEGLKGVDGFCFSPLLYMVRLHL
jgi:hypothetical protein